MSSTLLVALVGPLARRIRGDGQRCNESVCEDYRAFYSSAYLKCFLGSISSGDAPENRASHHACAGGIISMP